VSPLPQAKFQWYKLNWRSEKPLQTKATRKMMTMLRETRPDEGKSYRAFGVVPGAEGMRAMTTNTLDMHSGRIRHADDGSLCYTITT
jgi:hypothetical protein